MKVFYFQLNGQHCDPRNRSTFMICKSNLFIFKIFNKMVQWIRKIIYSFRLFRYCLLVHSVEKQMKLIDSPSFCTIVLRTINQLVTWVVAIVYIEYIAKNMNNMAVFSTLRLLSLLIYST